LQEPQLTARGIEAQDWAPLERALATISEGLGAEVVLHTYFGDAAPFINQLRQLPVHALGVDMVETDVVALGRNWQIGLVAGCLDGRRSLVEPLEETVELIKFLGETINPPTLYLSSNCDLEYLSPEVAEQKVLRLGEVAEQIRQVVRV
ncbi:MAG: hypothetical protein ACREP9_12370, partial [Candidatus Dormibacteraceae bacterium]